MFVCFKDLINKETFDNLIKKKKIKEAFSYCPCNQLLHLSHSAFVISNMSNLAWKHNFLLPFSAGYIISSAILASAFGHVEEVMGVFIPLKHNLKGGKKL